MAKKANAPICDRCETPFRSATPFCSGCGGPSPWATHDERVQWEVRQWRASRAASGEESQPMMLVRTEAGYQPMPVARYNEYVWDQPLHPERERQPAPEPAPRPAATIAPTREPETVPDLVPEPKLEPAREEPPAPPAYANGNGHGNGRHEAARTPEPYRSYAPPEPRQPEPQRAAAPEPPLEVHETAPRPAVVSAPVVTHEPAIGSEDRVSVTISKKAVALGLAIVIGLPFGGKIVGLLRGGPSAAPSAPVAGSTATPLVPARSGFTHAGPDAVRYAVVLKNPNKGFQASAVTLDVVFHDARGRLVGRASEGLSVVPAAGVTGVAGTVGVSAPASRMTVSIGRAGFQETTPAKPFVVRNVRMSRSGGSFLVRAAVSGVQAVKGARVVAVHLDRAGRVVGGDFTFADVPRSPGAADAVISTAGVPRSVTKVEVYVLR